MSSRRIWSKDEDEAFLALVQEYGEKNWTQIASKMGSNYGFKSRSGKQCRQRWHNHLNPAISKNSWTKLEQELMFQLHKIHGNKWTMISEHMPSRTDNSIKNYFYSTVRRSLRRMGKLAGSKNSTIKMRQIKPSTLSKIFNFGYEQEEEVFDSSDRSKLQKFIQENCEEVRNEIIQFANYKPKKRDGTSQEQKIRYQKVINTMVELNQIYESIKNEYRKKKLEDSLQSDYRRMMLEEQSNEDASRSNEEQNSDSLIISPPKKVSTRSRVDIKIPQRISLNTLSNSKHKNLEFSEKEPPQARMQIKPQFSILPPTILKPNSSQDEIRELLDDNYQYQNPSFCIQFKDQVPVQNPFNPQPTNSPGFFFNTPLSNNVNFFKSPNTPRSLEFCINSIQNGNGLQNNIIQDFQIAIRREIENNMKEGKKGQINPINSPLSAFRAYS